MKYGLVSYIQTNIILLTAHVNIFLYVFASYNSTMYIVYNSNADIISEVKLQYVKVGQVLIDMLASEKPTWKLSGLFKK